MFLHFTDAAGAEGIIGSGRLEAAGSPFPSAVFAVAVGGAWVPGVQRSKLGRAQNRDYALLFSTPLLPDLVHSEEAVWHLPHTPANVSEVFDLTDSKELGRVQELLDGSVGVDGETDLLRVPHHPAFSVWGDWVRMPEDFEPWTPGRDSGLYARAARVWETSESFEEVRKMWKPGISEALLRQAIRGLLEEVSASEDYLRRFEDPMVAVQAGLRDRLGQLPRSQVLAMAPGSAEVAEMVQDILDGLGVTDPATRELIARPLRMVPPVALLAPGVK